MSGLLDAVKARIVALGWSPDDDSVARAAVEAVAAWLERASFSDTAALLRAEVAPPKPTPEDVIREAREKYRDEGSTLPLSYSFDAYLAKRLRDAGILKEDT
jgi:hypothetical protein